MTAMEFTLLKPCNSNQWFLCKCINVLGIVRRRFIRERLSIPNKSTLGLFIPSFESLAVLNEPVKLRYCINVNASF